MTSNIAFGILLGVIIPFALLVWIYQKYRNKKPKETGGDHVTIHFQSGDNVENANPDKKTDDDNFSDESTSNSDSGGDGGDGGGNGGGGD